MKRIIIVIIFIMTINLSAETLWFKSYKLGDKESDRPNSLIYKLSNKDGRIYKDFRRLMLGVSLITQINLVYKGGKLREITLGSDRNTFYDLKEFYKKKYKISAITRYGGILFFNGEHYVYLFKGPYTYSFIMTKEVYKKNGVKFTGGTRKNAK